MQLTLPSGGVPSKTDTLSGVPANAHEITGKNGRKQTANAAVVRSLESIRTESDSGSAVPASFKLNWTYTVDATQNRFQGECHATQGTKPQPSLTVPL
jgi:hypothetical protein